MNILIVYNVDTSNEHKKSIVSEFQSLGYYNFWMHGNQKVFLPPNTFWKKDIDLKTPLQEIKAILVKLSIPESQLLNCIVVPASPWNAIPGVEIK